MSTSGVNANPAVAGEADGLDGLIARARAGDADAFDALVREYQGAVFRTAFVALGSREEAEEAAQDAFVSAFRRLHRFRGDSSFRTWLLAIAWRKALTRRRRLVPWRRRTVWRGANGADPLDDAVSPEPGPHARAAGREMRRQIRVLVRSLPSRLRDPLLLAASGEQPYEEIAAMLGIPIGTVKWRVSEARRIVRGKLRRLGYDR